ncbi:MAG TPA: DUF3368 domain-containing protein [Dongiaceae bacterium]|nr:DUF3368 domain-containing protein [Dongiaceae bacterium]
MPEVIANTTPFQYLHRLGLLWLLPGFYGRVVVPQAVADELARGAAEGAEVPRLSDLPRVEIRRVAAPLWPLPREIHRGEAEVLALAAQTAESLVVIDDSAAREHARALRLKFTGTLGILLRAKREGKLPLVSPWLKKLETLGFYLAPATKAEVLRQAGEAPLT